MQVTSYKDVMAKLDESKKVDLNESLPTMEQAIDEAIVKVTSVDCTKVLNDLIEGLSESDKLYTEVKISDNQRGLSITDSEGVTYSVYIDSY